ncbi:MAG: DegT/DnrJ/EryC1/StrS family aminotransferase [Sedimentisphaerales bacterium]|nr:DegT/DnrJ/EryC1/StrS family aminotransferase [Sedimentisphaerales bacterium]
MITAIKQNIVPFLDLRVTDAEQRQALLDAVARVLDHGRMIMGPEVTQWENELARRCGRQLAVGVNSGTDALYLAGRVLDLRPGDEVITTALSWVGTANGIALTGATLVFADIRDDLNIDPDSVSRLITPRTKAIMPVHYTGKACDMGTLQRITKEHNLPIIEDAAQAFGATYHGRPVGSFGRIACFSMNAMKVLAACGEAGAVLVDDPYLHQRLTALRYNGTINRETCLEPGLNARLDTLQAAILLVRLRYFDELVEKRRIITQKYEEKLAKLVKTPREAENCRDVWYTYTIQADRRDELRAYLAANGIETKIHHPILMPEQPAYRDGARGEWKHAKHLLKRMLSIPAHEKMTMEQVDYVAKTIRNFYGA